RLECLNAQPVQCWSAVQEHGVIFNHLFQDVPHNGFLLLHHFLGLLDGRAVPGLLQPVIDEWLEQFQSHLLRQTALVQLEFGADHDYGSTGVVHALAQQVLAKRPCLPFSVSERDFSGRLLAPRSTRPRRPLSNSASTASCNMRFSLRTITSGACRSISFFNRLLRLITRRYRSLRSDVAKRPPSSGTRGRNSGGMTGITSRIIQLGLLPLLRNASTTFKRLAYLRRFCSEDSFFIFSRSSLESTSISTRFSSSLIASAPIMALKPAARYC